MFFRMGNRNGFCECGCEGRTKRIKRNYNNKNLIKGDFNRFILGHNTKLLRKSLQALTKPRYSH